MIHYEEIGRWAHVVMASPQTRNALSAEMIAEMTKAFRKAFSSRKIKGIVLRGEGKDFCSGADLRALRAMQEKSGKKRPDSRNLSDLFRLIYTGPKLVLAQVHGGAYAGGFGLVSVCDIVFASMDSKFACTEVRIGFVPAIIMPYILRRLGEAYTKEVVLSAEVMNVLRARRMGLVNVMVPQGVSMEAEVSRFCERISSQNSAYAMEKTKEWLLTCRSMSSLDEICEEAITRNAYYREMPSALRGIKAFLDKQKLFWGDE